MKALVGAFNQEKALVGAFSVIVQLVVEPMDRFTAPVEANQKHNYKLQPRPKLKRETAQDVEDADILTDEDRPRSGAVNEITQKC